MKKLLFTVGALLLPLLLWGAPASDAGNMLLFDGTDDYASVADASHQLDNLDDEYTLELWVNFPAVTGSQPILYRHDVFSLYVTNTTYQVSFLSKTGAGPVLTSATGLSADTWYHIAVRRQDAGGGNYETAIFINGTKETTSLDADFALPTSTDNPLLLAYNSNTSNNSNVKMDEVRLWTTARSDFNINNKKGQSLDGSEAGLLGYYRFDAAGSGVFSDYSSTGLDGQLGDAAVGDGKEPTVLQSTAPIGWNLINPNGGTLTIGNPLSIQWAVDGSLAQVHLFFSGDGGNKWQCIAWETDNDGQFDTKVPGYATTNAIFRVVNPANLNEFDASDNPVTITDPGPGWKETIVMEAEDAIRAHPMVKGIRGTCFDCEMVYSFEEDQGTVTFKFTPTQGGLYVLWARAHAFSGNHNSFWVKVDGSEWYLWDVRKGPGFNWDFISNRGPTGVAPLVAEADPLVFHMNAGVEHTVVIRSREPYVRLDQLRVTNDLYGAYWGFRPSKWIELVSPWDKEEIERTGQWEIKWKSAGIGNKVSIELSFDEGQTYPVIIADRTENDGSFLWNVPDYNQATGYIRISKGGPGGGCPWDVMWRRFYFIDPQPSIALNIPNGGEVWQASSTQTISWTSTVYSGQVNLDYSIDNGQSWTNITSGQPATGTFDWMVPNTPTVEALVKVYNPSNPGLSDASNAAFEITAPITPAGTLALTFPQGGEVLYIGNNYNIAWTSDDYLGQVGVDVSIDSGKTWATLSTDNDATGTLQWTIPNAPTEEAFVRVYDPTDQMPADTSGKFSLVEAPTETLTVVYPNGGEVFEAGQLHNITWSASSGFAGTVDIDVSYNGGSNWENIIKNLPFEGTFEWPVPEVDTDSALVRVYDTETGVPADTSDSLFTIHYESIIQEDYALYFDGIDDFVQVANDPSLNVAELFTIEFWIKTSNPSQSWSRVLEKGSWDEYYIGFYGRHGKMHGSLRTYITGGYTRMTIPAGPSKTVVQPNTWYHVAATYDGNQATMYINGVPELTKTAVVSPRSLLGDLIIGAVQRDQDTYEYHLDATLDELRIWNVARTTQDIVQSIFNEITGTETGLVAYYNFNEGSGQTLVDYTTHGNDGRLGTSENSDDSDPAWILSDRPTSGPFYAFGNMEKPVSELGEIESPDEFQLLQNYPNPFNATTTISFNVPALNDGQVEIRLQVFDLQGRIINTLARGVYPSGMHQVEWNGATSQGLLAASGMYFIRLEAGDYSDTKRMIMLK
ncbi:T9SS type A sorting domain-containing protein [candidate division KSB1 bacterium]|nr:T9SS type A sorting domain-containing protein [candidate division KSB1 bacterium]